ncbi:unnamed protein product [Trichobilharzia regenti]|nr:unnamed protein product [Trichobilharzia regenti]
MMLILYQIYNGSIFVYPIWKRMFHIVLILSTVKRWTVNSTRVSQFVEQSICKFLTERESCSTG